MYKKLNKNGFTLIELLAVIVIMGVLMMVAIPAMTRYIENAKRDVFADTAKKYISAVRYTLLSDGYTCGRNDCGLTDLVPKNKDTGAYPTNSRLLIPANLIELENNTKKSPWGKNFDGTKAWIVVSNEGTANTPEYVYWFVGTDDSNNGIINLTSENNISRSVVKKANSSRATQPCTASECLIITDKK